jgi:hypothetical protein
MELRELHPLACHAVDIDGGNRGVTITAYIAIAHVVREDQNGVRLLLFAGKKAERAGARDHRGGHRSQSDGFQ